MAQTDRVNENSKVDENSIDDPLEKARIELERTGEIEGNAVITQLGGKIYAVEVGPDPVVNEYETTDTPYNQIEEVLVYDRADNEIRSAKDVEESYFRQHYEKLGSENLF